MVAPSPELSIVLPACDEVANVAPMCAALGRILAPLGLAEVIFIDDGSRDGTLAALSAAAAADPAVCYLSFAHNFGLQAARSLPSRSPIRWPEWRGQ